MSAHRFCLDCWYVLDGLTSPRCPECGRPFDAENADTYTTQPRLTFQTNRILPILVVALLFMVLEVFCIGFVWETAGEISSGLFGFVVVVGNLIVFASVLLRRPRLTAWLLAILVLLTCPYPVFLRIKLSMLESEAKRIIAFADGVKRQTGAYPADLSNYPFRRQWTSSSFRFSPDGFRLSWWAVQPGVSHWYTPAGGIGFYPD